MPLQKNTFVKWIYSPTNRHRLLGFSLLFLHLTIIIDTSSALRTVLISLHFALFLSWQPVWHGTTKVSTRSTLLIIVAITGFILWPGHLILTLWSLIILGIIGGTDPVNRSSRLAQWLASGWLIIILLLQLVPNLFSVSIINPLLTNAPPYIAVLFATCLILLPAKSEPAMAMVIDYLRSVFITLTVLILCLGSIIWTYISNLEYTLALFNTLLITAGFILSINWLWINQSGHTIAQTLWNRYVMNLGTPFETFLFELSASARACTDDPEGFLSEALDELCALEWIVGISAITDTGTALNRGDTSAFPTHIQEGELTLTVYTYHPLGPAFVLHTQLLCHLIAHFYQGLQREAEFAAHLKVEAIHQTGARLTHDIKNILQSMHYLTAVLEQNNNSDPEAAMSLLKRQFPILRKRLQMTLQKLEKPADDINHDSIPSSVWWNTMLTRYSSDQFHFENNLEQEYQIPTELFDSALENFLENARYKRTIEQAIQISVLLCENGGLLQLSVRDTGKKIPEEIAEKLFKYPVNSQQGLGIGLYQIAKLAERHQYHVSLTENRINGVTIQLRQKD